VKMEDERQEVTANADLSTVAVTLLKGVIYREGDERLWGALLDLQARVRDYVSVLGLELVLDEAEGYAFLRSRPEQTEDDAAPKPPRLIARRPISFPVSLLLALLRKKLAEFDAGGGDTRLVLARDDIVELIRRGVKIATGDNIITDHEEKYGFLTTTPSYKSSRTGKFTPPQIKRIPIQNNGPIRITLQTFIKRLIPTQKKWNGD